MKKINITKPGNYLIELTHEGDEIEVVGRLKATRDNHFQVNITLIHNAPHTKAKMTFRAIVDNKASLHLNGTVIINQVANDTESFLEEHILLLSEQAKAEAIPNLEIFNHNVKCSHAATIGQIDPEQVFYLQSRGLTETQAKQVIAKGFLCTTRN